MDIFKTFHYNPLILIKVPDPLYQTIFFSIILIGLTLISTRKRQGEDFLPKEVTNQIKGFAILAIIFSHIGYFLSSDPKFLFPFSIIAGVGVNLFLLLSGFGLTLSQLNSPLTPLSFYKKRLFRLFIPLWIIVTIFLLTDAFVLHKNYSVLEIIHSFLGFYPKADLFQNLDSPLWYFSIILFYYLIFPFTFIKKIPLLSPFLILLISFLLLNLALPVDPDALNLYKLHSFAFPLGVSLGLLIKHIKIKVNGVLKLFAFIIAVLVFAYLAVHSGVGEDPKIEQSISLITSLSLITIFSLSGFKFKLFSFLGIYSYEIYLLHWPILSRYNLFLGLPPFLDVTLNLILIIFLGYALQKIIDKIANQSLI